MLAYLLLLVPTPPLAGFVLLALDPYRLDRRAVRAAALVAGCAPLVVMAPMALAHLTGFWGDQIAPIFTLHVGNYEVALAVGLDTLSAVTALTVTFVSACVLIYALDYMSGARNADLRRFFALMNLFQAGMLSMVLAADSITFFLGWELMGLCSFFLISYNMTSPRAFAAGQKAFVITRIADAALLAGLLLLFLEAGSVRLADLIPAGAALDTARGPLIAALLLVGAMGKSAQFPFHTWLPTAMAGPTPVSALLHSATMVAAGAVLLARFAPVLAANDSVAAATAVAGVVTALFGAASAVAQTDVKRLLAYSSISQIGYMLVAVGVGVPAVAMAHFVVHALFKSLLFMASGVLAHAGAGGTSIAALRGTARRAPISFAAFAAGAASLAGLPLVTAGWWSKEAILASAFEAGWLGLGVWAVGLTAAALTAVYAFRPVFTALRAPETETPRGRESWLAVGPLVVLAVLALAGGLGVKPLTELLGGHPPHPALWVELAGAAAALLGIAGSAAVTFLPALAGRVARARRLRAGLQMDARYYALLVRPYRRFVRRLSGGRGEWVTRVVAPGRGTEGVERELEGAVRHARQPEGATSDPVGQATVVLGLWVWRALLLPFSPDRMDMAWMQGARGIGRAAERARRLQTGRVRDYALALALGLAALLLIGWGMTWR
ncbi:NADH-quinone oxidoreductase subunit L [Rhodosalinus sediminis]|uniref:NADH-quinone oxidoreductase subunit 5 family protein n=1 Tax=Rhodosalinus sediminis TaxID=1940533 RepID=UPI0023575219|nr:NADH-quinone oxidoreductase subunit L [Rhodosalinus sediminis]